MATSKRGGATPYRKGAAHENAVARFLREAGLFVMRSPKSASEIDLLAVRPVFEGESWVYFVQCKMGNYMRPAERKALIDLALRYNGFAVLAGGKGTVSDPFKFTDLMTGEALEFTPSADQRSPADSS